MNRSFRFKILLCAVFFAGAAYGQSNPLSIAAPGSRSESATGVSLLPLARFDDNRETAGSALPDWIQYNHGENTPPLSQSGKKLTLEELSTNVGLSLGLRLNLASDITRGDLVPALNDFNNLALSGPVQTRAFGHDLHDDSSKQDKPRPTSGLSINTCRSVPQYLQDFIGEPLSVGDLSNQRGSLYDEFDEVDTTAVLNYSASLIRLGFGQEANYVLQEIKEPDQEVVMLRDIAIIVDSDDPIESQVLLGQEHCDSAIALWSFLTKNDQKETVNVNSKAVLQALTDLSDPLRNFISFKVANRFQKYGLTNEEQLALRIGSRSDSISSEFQHQAALISHDDTVGIQNAIMRIEQSMRTNGRNDIDLLIDYVELKFKARDSIDDFYVELIESFISQYESNTDEALLQRARALTYMLTSRSRLGLLASQEIQEDHQLFAPTINDILSYALEQLSDVDFVASILAVNSSQLSKLESETAFKSGERLIGIGFNREFLDLFKTESVGNMTTVQFDQLRARAHMNLREYQKTLQISEGNEAENLKNLHLEALVGLGQASQVARYVSENEIEEVGEMASWLLIDQPNIPLMTNGDMEIAYSVAEPISNPLAADQASQALQAIQNNSNFMNNIRILLATEN
ncbi:MAG: hypothetical protein AB8C02_16505 [Halioglobus sp.]